MEILRRYQFPEVKAQAAADLLETLLDVVGQAAADRARFVMEDQAGGASAVDRAVKRHPAFAPFRLLAAPSYQTQALPFLSNVEGHRGPGIPTSFVSTQTLLALVRGVPRTHPFRLAEVLFTEQAPAQSALPTALPGIARWNVFGHPIPYWAFKLERGPRGYRAFVHAALSLGDSGQVSTKLPGLEPDVIRGLARFGKPKTVLLFRRTPEEQAVFEQTSGALGDLHEEWQERSRREMSMLPLRHDLPVDGTGVQYEPLKLPHKAQLIETFKPRGYRYESSESGNGGYALSKRTSKHNRLSLSFDLGSTWRHYSGGLEIRGIGGGCYTPLPAHALQHGTSYDVGSNDAFRQVIENVAVLVDHLERTFVPEAEALLGSSPTWYAGRDT